MRIDGRPRRTIEPDGDGVRIIDQTRLPFALEERTLRTVADAAHAIRAMLVRGAPLIGVTAAWGLALAMAEDASDEGLARAATLLKATRPTAINLARAVDSVVALLSATSPAGRLAAARAAAHAMAEDEVQRSRRIGELGAELLAAIHRRTGRPVQLLTHCNAGWLATVDWGTALAPVYVAVERDVPVHVWVDETRPRNQGASLTAWELHHHGVPATLIVDNAGGQLMREGRVDVCVVGTDRVTTDGDVCNKVGTYLKALAARDCGVPFHVAAPESSIDWTMASGADVPIEERSPREVTHLTGVDDGGVVREVRVAPEGVTALNPGFDVTPARLVTSLITERGITAASREGLLALFPERR